MIMCPDIETNCSEARNKVLYLLFIISFTDFLWPICSVFVQSLSCPSLKKVLITSFNEVANKEMLLKVSGRGKKQRVSREITHFLTSVCDQKINSNLCAHQLF